MKDQVAMAKRTGELCIAIPLYRSHHTESLGKMDGYSIQMFKDEPLAYVIEHPDFCQVINTKIAELGLDFLGDLEPSTTPNQEAGE